MYTTFYDALDSFNPRRIGVSIAYFMGAILKGNAFQVFAPLEPEEEYFDKLLRTLFGPDDEIWKHYIIDTTDIDADLDEDDDDGQGNINCLKGYACPGCNNNESLLISASSEFAIHDDGSGDHGAVHYDADSITRCPNGGVTGKLILFRLDLYAEKAYGPPPILNVLPGTWHREPKTVP